MAAVEFALFGPLLVFGLLAMTDVGLALHQRMAVDHILRAAAQHATEDPGVPAVEAVLEGTATGDSSGVWGASDLSFAVTRICTCAEAPDVEVGCSTTCATSKPTSIFYVMRSDLTVSGLLLPSIRLQPAMQVQIR
ncbi:TadE/TadG family type IV pilus assembly protein [Alkalilacustris brevis]|uniref:TadE/TadG family type IV pilus assembly protein n=1 Tax=Alkalilacustris brevis TaxID=2026338 RepID=UPI001EE3F3B2|nr:TadE family protein [Alkalilacustris brevis]